MLLYPAPQKFNTFNTFNTFAIFANFDPALECPTLLHRQTPRARSAAERAFNATSPLPARRERGQGGEGSTYTGFKLIPGSCSSRARWQAAHCPDTISSKAGGSVVQMSIA
jgi:hypothetical protein